MSSAVRVQDLFIPNASLNMKTMKNSLQGVASFEVGLSVLSAFERDAPNLTLSEIAQRCDITRFAARRYVSTLINLGYIETDGRRFWLTHRILRMGSVYLSASPLVVAIQPLLYQLTASVGDSSYLSVRDGADSIVVAKATGIRVTNRSHSIGAHFPLFLTSAGLCIASSLPTRELQELLAHYKPRTYTQHTLIEHAKIRAQVELARRRSFAVSERQLDDMVRGVAVPIHDGQGLLVGAISMNMFIGKASEAASVERVLPALLKTAEAANKIL